MPFGICRHTEIAIFQSSLHQVAVFGPGCQRINHPHRFPAIVAILRWSRGSGLKSRSTCIIYYLLQSRYFLEPKSCCRGCFFDPTRLPLGIPYFRLGVRKTHSTNHQTIIAPPAAFPADPVLCALRAHSDYRCQLWACRQEGESLHIIHCSYESQKRIQLSPGSLNVTLAPESMDKERDQPPPPAAPESSPKRPRADSGSSSSTESNLSRSVRTVTSEDLEYVHENGRTYGNDTYYLPCIYLPNEDFREQDRLSLQHRAFVYALQGKLTTTKLLPSTRRILDLGTGPGHWAVGMAHQYPDAEVVGIDLTQWDIETTEATLGESQVMWELDDLDVWGKETDIEDLLSRLAEHDFFADTTNRTPIGSPTKSRAGTDVHSQSDSSVENLTIDLTTLEPQPEPGWHFSAPFELIHLRNMKGAFTHWEEVYAEIYKSLSPGGWIEVADYDLGNVPAPPEEPDSSSYTMVNVRKLYASLMQASYKPASPTSRRPMSTCRLDRGARTKRSDRLARLCFLLFSSPLRRYCFGR
ncbi:predicted protein [Plenodomus lingam JN3]|uniref:Predicted protein n=1 Tax=Leptosphaeria maculans (strain JN3 / isolate v23.1.3 / race Av1-4-5-6-7-8) TaxID=985895 RepID=E5AB21_LEPMJ|nr:predicted protein [Plenodomus lingam JN3]CBY00862.1 predicted protein [Plenodomus lingam JN3]